jgi:hypothetical protein
MTKIKGKQLYDSTITQAKLNLTYPIYDYDAATKYYIDNITISAVTLNTNQTITGIKIFNSPVIMLNGLTVSGVTTYLNTQNLNVYNNYITINSGETGYGVTAGYAGIIVKRGSLSDYLIQWNETQGNFRVGVSGQTVALAGREDNPVNGNIATWDGTNFSFNTTLSLASITNSNSAYTLSLYNQSTGYTNIKVNSAISYLQSTSVITGNLIESGSNVLLITGGTGAVMGSGVTIQMKPASATTSGYLSSDDYNSIYNQINIIKALSLFGIIS